MTTRLTFYGGAGTVTGSRYLLESAGKRILIDCGLFQGLKQLRLRNWERFPVEPSSIDSVVLTHAHLDHSGYLPLLIRNGFRGQVHCTDATADLCKVLWPDSGHLMEKDAEFANRHGFSKHAPALPLYTERDARQCFDRLSPSEFSHTFAPAAGIEAEFLPAGHILGASIVRMSTPGGTIIFSGDLGRPEDPTMLAPATIEAADYVVVESTYGDRLHSLVDPQDTLADVVNRAVGRGGSVLIPTFAVGRVQSILYHLFRLKEAKRIPEVPIFLDSPMAINASDLFCRHRKWHRMSEGLCREICNTAQYVTTAEDSQQLSRNFMPKIILSASGMLTGGRVLHHLKSFGPDSRCAIVLAGFQAAGTRGASLAQGATQVKVHGGYVRIRAEVVNVGAMSAHADRDEILGWLRNIRRAPRQTFVTHGEPMAADALRQAIEERLKWRCRVPDHAEAFILGEAGQ